MKTAFMLMARYDGLPIIPLDMIREDYFGGMNKSVFMGKVESGEIPLPVSRLGRTQKSPKGVALTDLADYLDSVAKQARVELKRKIE